MIFRDPLHRCNEVIRLAITDTIEDSHVVPLDLLGNPIGLAAEDRGHMSSMIATVPSTVADEIDAVVGQALELVVGRPNARVDDVGVHAASRPRVLESVVANGIPVVDPIERPRHR